MIKHKLLASAVIATSLSVVAYIATKTPWLNPPECPSYATVMPDGSSCIIGANIGLGLWMIGVVAPLALVASILWVIVAMRSLKHRHKPN